MLGTLTSNNKRLREESYTDHAPILPHKKKIILGTNEKDRTIAAVSAYNEDATAGRPTSGKRKSIVVSNIGNSITPEYLMNYLSNELNTAKENILVTSLQSKGKSFNSLQYRISAPEINYAALMTPSTWPRNVRVRDYIFKRQNNTEASMDNFLEKETATRLTDLTPTTTPLVNNPTTSETARDESTATTDMEQID